jgi:hypothetical protein
MIQFRLTPAQRPFKLTTLQQTLSQTENHIGHLLNTDVKKSLDRVCIFKEAKVTQRPMLIGLLLTIGLVSGVFASQPDPNSPEGLLEHADAKKALALANEWRWTRKDIRSFVDTRDVTFELPGDKTVKIPLPDDAVMVAVAPYINQTHP